MANPAYDRQWRLDNAAHVLEYSRSWPRRSSRFNNDYARRILAQKGMPENYIEDVSLELVWNAQDGRCAICRLPAELNAPRTSALKAHFDHRYPLCWGGYHIQENIQMLHQVCHTIKGGRTPRPKGSG